MLYKLCIGSLNAFLFSLPLLCLSVFLSFSHSSLSLSLLPLSMSLSLSLSLLCLCLSLIKCHSQYNTKILSPSPFLVTLAYVPCQTFDPSPQLKISTHSLMPRSDKSPERFEDCLICNRMIPILIQTNAVWVGYSLLASPTPSLLTS